MVFLSDEPVAEHHEFVFSYLTHRSDVKIGEG